jgi:hypothetical protein
MAIVRCQDHPPRTTGYEIAVEPVGYPDTALVCGRDGPAHDAIGWVFPLPDEYEEYQRGQRVFQLWGPESSLSASMVRVSDDLVEVLGDLEEDESEDGTQLQSHSSIDRS